MTNVNKGNEDEDSKFLLETFFSVERDPYPALACIPASAAAAVQALKSSSTRKCCISHLAGSWLKEKEDKTVSPSSS